jgi:hypothetical protein
VLTHLDGVLLHVRRGVRRNSDHVVILADDVRALALEVVRGDYLGRDRFGLDFFDAGMRRDVRLGDRPAALFFAPSVPSIVGKRCMKSPPRHYPMSRGYRRPPERTLRW